MSASTAVSTCRGCGAVISADSDGTVWDAVAELRRLRDAAGWATSEHGLHFCRICVADGLHLTTQQPPAQQQPRGDQLSLLEVRCGARHT